MLFIIICFSVISFGIMTIFRYDTKIDMVDIVMIIALILYLLLAIYKIFTEGLA